MPSIPRVLKAKLPHRKEGGFLINFSFSLLTCCCKPMSFCNVKGIHLLYIHMGPLSPLTTTKEKHFIALAVLESQDLLFAFTSRRAVAGWGLLQWIWHPGDGHQGTQLTIATEAIICCWLRSTGRMESTQNSGFSQSYPGLECALQLPGGERHCPAVLRS